MLLVVTILDIDLQRDQLGLVDEAEVALAVAPRTPPDALLVRVGCTTRGDKFLALVTA